MTWSPTCPWYEDADIEWGELLRRMAAHGPLAAALLGGPGPAPPTEDEAAANVLPGEDPF